MIALAQVTAHIPPPTTIAQATAAESNIDTPKGSPKADSISCPMAKNCAPIQRKNEGTWIAQLSRSAVGPNCCRNKSATVAACVFQNRSAKKHPVKINVAPQAIGSSNTSPIPPRYIFEEDSMTDEDPNHVASKAKTDNHKGTWRSATRYSASDSTRLEANRPTIVKKPTKSNSVLPSTIFPSKDKSLTSIIPLR